MSSILNQQIQVISNLLNLINAFEIQVFYVWTLYYYILLIVKRSFTFHPPGISLKWSSARVTRIISTLASPTKTHLPGSLTSHRPWHPQQKRICQGFFHLIHPWQIVKMVVYQGRFSLHNPGISQKVSFARVDSTPSTPGISLKSSSARVAFHSTPLAFFNKSHLPGSFFNL